MGAGSAGLVLRGLTADAAELGHQLSSLHIKCVLLHDLPFMETAVAQGFAAVAFGEAGAFEWNHFTHGKCRIRFALRFHSGQA